MKRRRNKLATLVLLVTFLLHAFCFNVMAAEETNEIKTVKLKVTNDDGLIQFTSREEDMYKVLTEGKYYDVGEEWIGFTIEIEPQSGYHFRDNVSVSLNGDTGGVKRLDKWKTGNNLKVEYEIRVVKGRLEAPYDVRWGRDYGIARWEEPDSDSVTGYIVRINGQNIEVYDNKVDLTYYLQKGHNSFKVKSTSTISGLEDSEWVESDNEIYSSYDRYWANGNTSSNTSGSSGPGFNNVVGWVQYNNNWYYIDSTGRMLENEFVADKGKRYYLGSGGVMVTGWQLINGTWYYFDASGAMYTNPRTMQGVYGHTYYFNDDGSMRCGWQKNAKGCYYVKSDGNPCINGEFLIGEDYYRFNGEGFLITGWWQDPNTGYWYYYNPAPGYPEGFPNGSKMCNTFIRGINGSIYYVDSTGRWIP